MKKFLTSFLKFIFAVIEDAHPKHIQASHVGRRCLVYGRELRWFPLPTPTGNHEVRVLAFSENGENAKLEFVNQNNETHWVEVNYYEIIEILDTPTR